jgi:serine/threonine protein kinase/Tfp pilus assembly protein PilF
MTSDHLEESGSDDRWSEALAASLDAVDNSARNAVLARYPEFAPRLADFHARRARVERWAAPLRNAVQGGPQVDARLAGNQLGDFSILREVGRGGMGIVYEAEQISLSRRVALKMLPFAATMDPRHLQRFQNEARAAASLEHPHIVPVYGVGCERGVHYYAMKFIEGQSLAQKIADRVARPESSKGVAGPKNTPFEDSGRATPVDSGGSENTAHLAALTTQRVPRDAAAFRQIAQWGIQSAEALEHAHSLGIVHRDIKPANLMIDSNGSLWVTDFGLARTAADAGLTMTGDVLGTLRYMSPEQALAKHGLVDHRTDVYSLGVTLYELLTGNPAVEGKDREEILNAITLEEPRPLRALDAAIPHDVETIVLKALEKNPADRYATAQELADDLRRLIKDEPIRARRPSGMQRMVKWSRRHRTFVRAATLFLVLISVTLAASTWFLVREQKRTADERDRAESEKNRAETSLDFASQVLDKVYMNRIEQGMPKAKEITPEDREFLQLALRFYQTLADQQDNNVSARVKSATAFYRVGKIQIVLELNDDSLTSSGRAIELWAALAAEFRDVARYRWEEAKCHHNLASALSGSRRLQEAEKEALRSLQLHQQLAQEDGADGELQVSLALCLNMLSHCQFRQGKVAEAETGFGDAIRIFEGLPPEFAGKPQCRTAFAMALANLASCFVQEHKPAEAEKYLRLAIKSHQDLARDFPAVESGYLEYLSAAYTTLGIALAQQRRWDEAKTEMVESIKVMRRLTNNFPTRPGYYASLVMYSLNLAEMLSDAGMESETELQFRSILELLDHPPKNLSPGDAQLRSFRAHACNGLATLLARRADVSPRSAEEAVSLAQKATELEAKSGEYWMILGVGLSTQDKLAEAEAAFRAAIELEQDHPMANCNLGQVLLAQGRFVEALPYFRKGHTLGSKKTNWSNPSAQWLQQCERMVELEPKLAKLLKGELKLTDVGERLAMAQMCLQHKGLYLTAFRLFTEAFAEQSQLVDDRRHQQRYDAACAAARAGCRQGKDADQIDDKERVRLRRQALDWLRAELAAWRHLLEKEPDKARPEIEHTMLLWQHDKDLAGVRDPKALDNLPESERRDWQKLWAEVEEFRQKLAKPVKQAGS